MLRRTHDEDRRVRLHLLIYRFPAAVVNSTLESVALLAAEMLLLKLELLIFHDRTATPI